MVEMSIRTLHTDPMRNHQHPLMRTVIIQPLTSDFRDLKKHQELLIFVVC